MDTLRFQASNTERMLTLTTKAEEASEEATRYKKDLVATQEALAEMKEKAETALSGNADKDDMITQNIAKMETLQAQERDIRLQHHELRQEHEALVTRWGFQVVREVSGACGAGDMETMVSLCRSARCASWVYGCVHAGSAWRCVARRYLGYENGCREYTALGMPDAALMDLHAAHL